MTAEDSFTERLDVWYELVEPNNDGQPTQDQNQDADDEKTPDGECESLI